MPSFRNFPVFVFVAGLGLTQLSACGRAQESAKNSTTEKTMPAAALVVKNADAAKEKDRLDLPVPKGQPQRGLRIPIYSPDGKLRYSFEIGVGEKVDDDHVKLAVAHVESFKENGEHEFDIDLPDSVFNAKTKELTSNAHVRIKRHDFEISGNSMTFNTDTKVAKFGGGVKMVIYDAGAAAAEADGKPAVPTIEVKAVKEEKK